MNLPQTLTRRDGRRVDRVALVIAHPDDEAMFFVPTIVALQSSGVRVHVLCLSEGNFYGLGATRRAELHASCTQVLRVAHCQVLDDPRLQDGASIAWDAAAVAEQIQRYLAAHAIANVVTFDAGGVSGHRDHVAVCRGAERLIAASRGDVALFVLETVSLVRKYCLPLDLLLVWLWGAANLLLNGEPWLVYLAMRAHASQLVWFRYLFIVFSRYTIVNTLRQL